MQQRPKKISLRVEVSSTPSHTLGRGGEDDDDDDDDNDDDDDDDEQRRRIGGANRRTRTIDSLSERDVMSMSLGEESGGGATDEATFMSPPPVSSDSRSAARRRSGVMATTPLMMMTTPTPQKASSSSPDLDPMSVERQSGCGSPRLYYGGASKRPRHSNDWVEDEVHPSKVFFGSVMASSMAKAFVCNTTISSPEGDQISQCAATTGDSSWSFGGAAPLHHSQSDLPSLLRRTLSGTYDDHHHNQQYHESGGVMGGGSGDAATASRGASSSAIGIPAPGTIVVPATNGGVISRDDFASAAYYHQQNGGGLPPSSPSDPSPLLDLRKAALMRSSSQNRRFANPSKNNVAAATSEISAKAGAPVGLPPRWRAQCGIRGDEPPKRRDGHGGASAPHKEGSDPSH